RRPTTFLSFSFTDTTPSEIYTLSLHDALPIYGMGGDILGERTREALQAVNLSSDAGRNVGKFSRGMLQRVGLAQALVNNPELLRSEEHTSELQSLAYLVCRLLLEKKKKKKDVN